MSSSKQISLLLILLIAFIAFCTKYHLDNFVVKTDVISKPNEIQISVEKFTSNEKITKKQEVNKNEPIVEVVGKEEPKTIKEELTPISLELTKTTESTITKKNIAEVIKKVATKKSKNENTKKDILQSKVQKRVYSLSKENLKIQYEINNIIKTKRIIFKRLSTDVTQDSLEAIKDIASLLKKHNTIMIEVAGHTDAKGEDEVNKYISQQRAKSVKKELIKAGIEEARITSKGYGESMPIVLNNSLGYSKINRRVEFNIIEE